MSSGAGALHGTSLVFAGHVKSGQGMPVTIRFREPVSIRAIRVVPRGDNPHPNHLPEFVRYGSAAPEFVLCRRGCVGVCACVMVVRWSGDWSRRRRG